MAREYHYQWIDTRAKECNKGWHIYVSMPDKRAVYTILDKTNSTVFTGYFRECECFFNGYRQRKWEENQ